MHALTKHTLKRFSQLRHLSSQSSLYSWGMNDEGNLGHRVEETSLFSSHSYISSPQVVDLQGHSPVHVSTSDSHSAFVCDHGHVFVCGKNNGFVLGDVDAPLDVLMVAPEKMQGLQGTKIVSTASTSTSTVALSEDGDLYSWGTGGATDTGSTLGLGPEITETSKPTKIDVADGKVKFTQISAGMHHVMAIGEEGEVWGWGSNDEGQLGNPVDGDMFAPEPIDYFLDGDIYVKQIVCAAKNTIALTEDGKVYVWGDDMEGITGTMSERMGMAGMGKQGASTTSPARMEFDADVKIAKVAVGPTHAAAVTDSGDLYYWGNRMWMTPRKMKMLKEKHVVDVACGTKFTVALTDMGEVYTWGKNSKVQGLGEGAKASRSPEKNTLLQEPIKQLFCGSNHTFAIAGLP